MSLTLESLKTQTERLDTVQLRGQTCSRSIRTKNSQTIVGPEQGDWGLSRQLGVSRVEEAACNGSGMSRKFEKLFYVLWVEQAAMWPIGF